MLNPLKRSWRWYLSELCMHQVYGPIAIHNCYLRLLHDQSLESPSIRHDRRKIGLELLLQSTAQLPHAWFPTILGRQELKNTCFFSKRNAFCYASPSTELWFLTMLLPSTRGSTGLLPKTLKFVRCLLISTNSGSILPGSGLVSFS